MGNPWQFFIKGWDGKTTIVNTESDATVDDLMKKTCSLYGIAMSELRLMFAGKQLEHGQNKAFDDYHLENRSTLFVLLRLRGGWNPVNALRQRKMELAPLPGFIRVCGEPDMITFDDDPGVRRAKMPCGHVLGPDTMTSFCQMQLKDGKFRFLCPHVDYKTNKECKTEWQWFLVRHVAALSDEQVREFEEKICENYLMKAGGYQQCPGCSNMSFREDVNNLRVVCPVCSKKSPGRPYEFCWACLQQWKGNKRCDNNNCDGLDQRIRYLKQTTLKTIGSVSGCPSVRACPQCGILINHADACKHMTCKCGHQFCFVCLTKYGSCGGYNAACSVAPIQNEMPSNV